MGQISVEYIVSFSSQVSVLNAQYVYFFLYTMIIVRGNFVGEYYCYAIITEACEGIDGEKTISLPNMYVSNKW